MEKVRWSQLTKLEQANFGDGCTFVPDFCFGNSCRQHDFNYSRGGSLKDKIKADFNMAAHMLAYSSVWWHYAVIVTYWVGLTLLPFPYAYFEYGPYKTKEEILADDYARKYNV